MYGIDAKPHPPPPPPPPPSGLDQQQCVWKLRFLTLASLAVEAREIPFNTLREELSLQQDQLDMCILEGEVQYTNNGHTVYSYCVRTTQ